MIAFINRLWRNMLKPLVLRVFKYAEHELLTELEKQAEGVIDELQKRTGAL